MKNRNASFAKSLLLFTSVLLTILSFATVATAARWSTPKSLSGWTRPTEFYKVLYAPNDTVAVIWLEYDMVNKQVSFWARVRPPGGAWETSRNLTGWTSKILMGLGFFATEMDPDGIIWFLWAEQDPGLPSPNVQVKATHRDTSGAWHSENLSSLETRVRAVDLHTSPDGHMAAVWTACSTSSTDLWQGPCRVRVRRRPAGSAVWLPTEDVDGASGAGISTCNVRVGTGQLTSVTWAESNPSASIQWKIAARAHTAASGWETAPTDVTNWLEPRDHEGWLSRPVMGEDGTEILSWTAKTALGSANDAQYSSTRAGATGSWSSPTKISTDRVGGSFDVPRLAIRSGTTLAAWAAEGSGKEAVFANVRDPGGVWGAESQLSSWIYSVYLQEQEIWSHDGTVMVVWQVEDDLRPSTEDQGLFYCTRSKGCAWNPPNQIGGWVYELKGAGVELTSYQGKGSGEIIYCIKDATKPAGQQAAVLRSFWPAGGTTWETPGVLADDFYFTAMMSFGWGMAGDPSGLPLHTGILVGRNVALPDNPYAIFHCEKKEWPLPWIPLLIGD